MSLHTPILFLIGSCRARAQLERLAAVIRRFDLLFMYALTG